MDSVVCGQSYVVTCELNNPNYVLNVTNAKLNVLDYCHVNKLDGSKVYFSKIQDALLEAVDGETIVLNSNRTISKPLTITKNVTIDGSGLSGDKNCQIKAASSLEASQFENKNLKSMINLFESTAKLTLKNVTIDGNNLARCISAFSGNVTLENATITNGKKVDDWRSGGVLIANNATFNMLSGEIEDNDASDEEYTKYCADLYIAANAEGVQKSSIVGGEVENLFIEANTFSASDAGKFTLNGGEIENAYIEYKDENGARFEYLDGEIENLLISMKNDNCSYYGVSQNIIPVKETTYIGGKLVYVETNNKISGVTYNALNELELVDYQDYIFEGCTFNFSFNTKKKIGLIFNDCKFTNYGTDYGIYVTSVKHLIVNNCQFNGNNAIDANLYSTECQNIVISNNLFNVNDESEIKSYAIAIKTRFGGTDYPGSDNQGTPEGTIEGVVVIVGNDYNANNCNIELGAKPQEGTSSPNKSTGNFNVFLSKNKDALTVYNRFKDNDRTGDANASKSNLKVDETIYLNNKQQ